MKGNVHRCNKNHQNVRKQNQKENYEVEKRQNKFQN